MAGVTTLACDLARHPVSVLIMSRVRSRDPLPRTKLATNLLPIVHAWAGTELEPSLRAQLDANTNELCPR